MNDGPGCGAMVVTAILVIALLIVCALIGPPVCGAQPGKGCNYVGGLRYAYAHQARRLKAEGRAK